MRNIFLDNLIELQKLAGDFSGAPTGRLNQFNWVLNKQKHWPSAIVGIPNEDEIADISNKIEIGELPPFWVIPSAEIKDKLSILKQYGLREIWRWDAMALKMYDFNPTQKSINGFEIKRVVGSDDLKNWLEVVKPVLMPDKIILKKVLKGLMKHTGFLMTVGYFNQLPISTCLAFRHEGITCLYFFATLPEYQGKGYGSILISNLIEESFSLGSNEIILHSTVAGKKLYSKLGFKSEGEISTFWKLGKY